MYIDVESLIFWFFTVSYATAMFIHLYMNTSSRMWGWGGKKRWEMGLWGYVLIVFYVIFLVIYGGFYW